MDEIQIIKNMLETNPENGLAWYLLGIKYVEKDNESEALYAFSQALNYCNEDFKDKIFEQLRKFSLATTKATQPENSIVNTDLPLPLKEKDDETQFNYNNTEDTDEDFEDDNVVQLSIIKGGNRDTMSLANEWSKPDVTFKNVGGYDDLKEVISMKIIKPFNSQGLFSKYKKKVGGGILMFGPPGCGKTFMVKATAGECQAFFSAIHITDILDPYLGMSEQNIKDIFLNARRKKPCVLFFDEIDTIGYNRAKLSSEHMRPIIDQFLTEIEGIDSDTQNMLIIGATNMPWDIDPAFKRPGRFDKVVFVPPPDKKARIEILKLKMSDRPQEKFIDYNSIAEKTEIYSGADLENVIETATENVITEIMQTGSERLINTKDLLKAVGQTRSSAIEWLKTMKNYVKYSNQAGIYDEVEKYLSQKSRYI